MLTRANKPVFGQFVDALAEKGAKMFYSLFSNLRAGSLPFLVLLACSPNVALAVPISAGSSLERQSQLKDANAQIEAITVEVWEWYLEGDLYLRLQLGLPIVEIKDLTPEQLDADAAIARLFKNRLENIDECDLDHEHAITRKVLAGYLEEIILAPQLEKYRFRVTPYSGGNLLTPLLTYAAQAPLGSVEQRESYLRFLREYAKFIGQLDAKTRRQAELGILLPKPAIPAAVGLVSNLKAGVAAFVPDAERVPEATVEEAEEFRSRAHAIAIGEISPAYQNIIEIFDEHYKNTAPSEVGLAQYPGGQDAYQTLIELYLRHPYSAEEVHQIGLRHMDQLRRQMADLRAELGFKGTQREFHEMLRSDPRFIAKTAKDVEERYEGHIARIEPMISDYFSYLPIAPYGVMRLSPANEAGQTFGYYQLPSLSEPRGLYRFNGSHLESRSLVTSASLIFHELVPGHHFQLATQRENEALPQLRRSLRSASLSAFIEGWAEYAAELGYEMGLYDDPYDRYGRLVMSSFLTSRLVVDTGLNSLGWTLEEARAYLLENTMMSELEVNTETLRYSTDLPAQALGYRLGRDKIEALRKKAEAELGDNFDIRAFHGAALQQGSLPLDVLEDQIAWYIENTKKE